MHAGREFDFHKLRHCWTTRFRECECRRECGKKGSSTRDTSPASIRAFQGQKSTSFAILFLVSPGPCLRLRFQDARGSPSRGKKEDKGSRPTSAHPEKVLREERHISRPANLKILKSTFLAVRMMAPDDC